jgi:hypothetical protein
MAIVTNRRSFLAGLGALFAAPAIVRADSLMPVRSIVHFILPSFGFDSFDASKPADVDYQWIAKEVLGDKSLGNLPEMVRAGWRPVAASEFVGKFNIAGSQIEHGGCVLMWRDKGIAAAFEKRRIAAAHRLVTDWRERQEADGFSVFIRQSPMEEDRRNQWEWIAKTGEPS